MSDSETPAEPLGFSAALQELESILERIDNDETDIDQLGEELGRATELLELCRAKIRKAEVEVRQIVDKLDDSSADKISS